MKMQNSLLTDFDDFQEKDNGWALKRIINLLPLRACSFIELPLPKLWRKACINVQNEDNLCFTFAIVSALYPAPRDIIKRTRGRNPVSDVNRPNSQLRQNNVSVSLFPVYTHQCIDWKQWNQILTYLTSDTLLLVQDSYYYRVILSDSGIQIIQDPSDPTVYTTFNIIMVF